MADGRDCAGFRRLAVSVKRPRRAVVAACKGLFRGVEMGASCLYSGVSVLLSVIETTRPPDGIEVTFVTFLPPYPGPIPLPAGI
jgi:hypothetical protein